MIRGRPADSFIETFHPQYVLHQKVGQGAYGSVYRATDLKSGRDVAIKKIARLHSATVCRRTFREIRLLRHFNHENIVSLYDVLQPPSIDHFSAIYLVQEWMTTDLHSILHRPHYASALTDEHRECFMYQIFCGLEAMHSAGVWHRDLKPANILVDEWSNLKICDLGLARARDDGRANCNMMTEYVATRWYRAPEVMLMFKEYDEAMDMWSAGCVFAEILGGKPLFPGKDYFHQLGLILDVLGQPSEADLAAIKFERSRNYIRSLPCHGKRDWKDLYPTISEHALDLLDRLLRFNPRDRIGVGEALRHPYLEGWSDAATHVVVQPLPRDVWSVDMLRTEDPVLLRGILFQEVMRPKINRYWHRTNHASFSS